MFFGAKKGTYIKINYIVCGIALIAFFGWLIINDLNLVTIILGSLFSVWVVYCWFGQISGYILDGSKLFIKRKIKDIIIDLKSISTIEEISSNKISLSLGTHLNIFSWMGVFQSKALGKYEAYATNTNNLVLIVLPNMKIVVSPNDPKLFINEIEDRPKKEAYETIL